jgi:hypothetical protein
MSNHGNAWDRLSGESEAQYARFLTYRNLGPARSLDAAYRLACRSPDTLADEPADRSSAPGNWRKDCVQFEWVRRATAWDIANLEDAGRRVVAAYIALLESAFQRALEGLASPDCRPRTWAEIVEALGVFGELVPVELAQAAIAQVKADESREPVRVHPTQVIDAKPAPSLPERT